jgi:hypothetical protein
MGVVWLLGALPTPDTETGCEALGPNLLAIGSATARFLGPALGAEGLIDLGGVIGLAADATEADPNRYILPLT